MKMRYTDHDGTVREGLKALAYGGNGNGDTRNHSGIERLRKALTDKYGLDKENITTVALDKFFEFHRGNLTLQEYLAEFDQRYETAVNQAQLSINDVG